MNRIISFALFLSLNLATFTVTRVPGHTNVSGNLHVHAHGAAPGPSATQLNNENRVLRTKVASLQA